MQPSIHIGSAACALALAGVAQAGMVQLSGGWEASWDSSLDPFVDIFDVAVVNAQGVDVQVIQKSAEFTQAPPFPGFPFPSIPITFTQTRPDAVQYIAIDDEIITNNTGVDWYDFHMVLLDSGNAHFDPVRTANSGGAGPLGFTIDPFQQASFSADLMEFDVWDGVIPDGTQWFPGDGATDGQLWIELQTGDGVNDPFTTFTLKETPTIPTPGVLGVLGVAGLAAARRRR